MVNVLGAVAQWEREATAERTSAALQVLKAQGRATGGVAPYGFQFIDGRREWHQGEQETLAAIIEHRRARLSWAKVADKLNATEHRTRTGGQWTRGPLSARQAPAHPRQDRSHCPLMLALSLSLTLGAPRSPRAIVRRREVGRAAPPIQRPPAHANSRRHFVQVQRGAGTVRRHQRQGLTAPGRPAESVARNRRRKLRLSAPARDRRSRAGAAK